MADDTIRVLFNKIDELTVQVTRLETLLVNSVIVNQKHNAERLDRHSKKLDYAFKRIENLENAKENVISFKNIVIGIAGLVATCIGIAVGVNQLMK